MTATVARRVARARSRRRSVGARRARVLGDLGADVVRVVPPTGDVLAGNIARAWNAGKQVVALADDRPRARCAPRRRRRRVRPTGRTGNASARSGARTGRGMGPHLRVRPRRAARRLGRIGSRRDGRVGEHVLHRRSRPGTDPLDRTHRLRALRAGGRVRGDDGARERSPPTRRPFDAGSGAGREHGRARTLPGDGRAWKPTRREHRPHPRDLADPRRLRLVRTARREGARPEPRHPHEARCGRRRGRRRAREPRLERLQPEHRDRRRPRRDRDRGRRVLLAPHHAGALRHRGRDQPDARARQLAARDLPVGPVGGPRLLRARRRRKAIPAVVRDHALPRRRSRAREAGRRHAGRSNAPRSPRRVRARPAAPRAGGHGKGSRSSSSDRARPARSRRATSWSTARRCCASSRRRGPTSCGRIRWRRTIRTASSSPRCTTASTSARRTSR